MGLTNLISPISPIHVVLQLASQSHNQKWTDDFYGAGFATFDDAEGSVIKWPQSTRMKRPIWRGG
jgi:hypothetical protein